MRHSRILENYINSRHKNLYEMVKKKKKAVKVSPATVQETQRVASGIKGFDKLVQGGFLPGKCVLLSGSPGTGKSIFSLQYLYNGATMYGEKGLYVSLEEEPESLRNQASQFGWDIKALEDKGDFIFFNIPCRDIKESTASEIIRVARKLGVKRMVLDSLSSLAINVPATRMKVSDITEYSIKRFLYHFIDVLKELRETTVLLISQSTDHALTKDSVSEFICDGVLSIKYESMGGDFSRSLSVRKMRETKNNEDIHPLEISDKGIIIHDIG